jgi:hypothetical protein
MLAQKYFLDGELIVVGNLGLEATRAERKPIADLPPDFDWPTDPEMEIELETAAGVSYRFAPNWFVGGKPCTCRRTRQKWVSSAGRCRPARTSITAARKCVGTPTWLPQIQGGGEQYEGQADRSLHLIEKTKYESA